MWVVIKEMQTTIKNTSTKTQSFAIDNQRTKWSPWSGIRTMAAWLTLRKIVFITWIEILAPALSRPLSLSHTGEALLDSVIRVGPSVCATHILLFYASPASCPANLLFHLGPLLYNCVYKCSVEGHDPSQINTRENIPLGYSPRQWWSQTACMWITLADTNSHWAGGGYGDVVRFI